MPTAPASIKEMNVKQMTKQQAGDKIKHDGRLRDALMTMRKVANEMNGKATMAEWNRLDKIIARLEDYTGIHN